MPEINSQSSGMTSLTNLMEVTALGAMYCSMIAGSNNIAFFYGAIFNNKCFYVAHCRHLAKNAEITTKPSQTMFLSKVCNNTMGGSRIFQTSRGMGERGGGLGEFAQK